MSKVQFAGLRTKHCTPLVVVSNGGSFTSAVAGSWEFRLQARNRQGYNLYSDPTTVTIAAGDKVDVTLPADSRRDGEDVQEILIIAKKTGDTLTLARPVAGISGYGADRTTLTSLPVTLTLSCDGHLAITDSAQTVANEVALPTGSDRVNRMRRYISATNQIKAYHAETNTWELVSPPSFSSYVVSTISELGCNQDIRYVANYDGVIIDDYDSSSPSSLGIGADFWLCNDTLYDIPAGAPIEIKSTLDDKPFPKGLIQVTVLGYANTTTGNLDVTGSGGVGTYPGVDIPFAYMGTPGELVLEKDLPSGWALKLRIKPNFQDYELNGLAIFGGILGALPEFSTNLGTYAPGTAGMGDYIVGEPDTRRRIVPQSLNSALALPGAGLVKQREFRSVGSQIVLGFAANSANQNIAIDGSGICYVTSTVPSGATLRAVAGTVDGAGRASAFAGSISLDNTKLLSVTVTHATAIRSDYPDVIAGSTDGQLNADKLRVYVKNTSTGAITYYDAPVTNATATETVTVGGVAGTSVGTTMPTVADSFGLYEPGSYTTSTPLGASTFTTMTASIALAYVFEDTITFLSHTAEGCITEFDGTVAQKIAALKIAALEQGLTVDEVLFYQYAFG